MSSYTRQLARALSAATVWRETEQDGSVYRCRVCRYSWPSVFGERHSTSCAVGLAREWLELFPEARPPIPTVDGPWDPYWDE